MNKKLPEYLLKFSTNVKMIAFVTAFSFLFIFVYTPFSDSLWFNSNDSTMRFVFSSATIFGGSIVLLVSRLWLVVIGRHRTISLLQYIFWLLAEIVLIAFLYSIFNALLLDDPRNFTEILQRALVFVSLILVLPYLISYLYLALREKDTKIAILSAQNNVAETTEQSMEPLPQEGEPVTVVRPESTVINFTEENGSLRLSIKSECVYYIESADNYVNVYYIVQNKLKHCLVRTSLKKVEEMVEQYGFVRCHRSYLVNLSKVKIVRKEDDAFLIDMDQEGVDDIPISKTYADQILKVFVLH